MSQRYSAAFNGENRYKHVNYNYYPSYYQQSYNPYVTNQTLNRNIDSPTSVIDRYNELNYTSYSYCSGYNNTPTVMNHSTHYNVHAYHSPVTHPKPIILSPCKSNTTPSKPRRNSGSSMKSPTPTRRNKESEPSPQNLKKDPYRLAKTKTELCLLHLKGKCPFGADCNYAHGEHELKYTKLIEMERAGLIVDAKVYRTHPCWCWVATGACPFGLRCTGIHDPKIANEIHAWLPHAEVCTTKLTTVVNVDRFYNQRLRSVHQTNPLLHDGELSWYDTYRIVCNVPFTSNGITELQRMKIVLKLMNYTSMDYMYHPTHSLHDIPCMILKKAYFDIKGDVSEVAQSESKNDSIITTCIIAFGPMHEQGVEPASIYFNIPQEHLVPCDTTQAKRSKRFKTKPCMVESIRHKLTISPFYLPQPIDDNANDLVLDMYRHRIHVLSGDRLTYGQFEYLAWRFYTMKEALRKFHYWPKQKGREILDEDTTVPHCRQEYEVKGGGSSALLWESYIRCMKDNQVENVKRLDIFHSLSKDLSHTSSTIPKLSKDRLFILDPSHDMFKEWDMIMKVFEDDGAEDVDKSPKKTPVASPRDKDFPISAIDHKKRPGLASVAPS